MRRSVVAVAVVGLGVVGIGAAVLVTGGSGGAATAATNDAAPATATVTRRDLVLADDVDGTLGYADARTLAASAPGTVTRVPAEGIVVTRGRALYDVDAQGVRLLYGSMPLWRRLGRGVSDGADVEQLERNLVELGHDPGGMTVDEEFDADTRAAVKEWQDALGVPETGAVEPGDAVFLPGPRRIGQVTAAVGAQVQPGMDVMTTTATAPVVHVDLDARRRELVTVGGKVTVELPSGRTVPGTIDAVGNVAESSTGAQGEPGPATVSVVVRLAEPAKRDGLDGAPVVVSLERERANSVLAVPVEALLALRGGGVAVELVGTDGERTLTAVETGSFADGYVEIEGKELREGARVVVAE